MRDFRMIVTILAALALWGCAESSEPEASAPAPQPVGAPSGDAGDDAIEQARRDAAAATAAAGDLDPLASLGDSTATEALESYLAACTAGDFIRAADFCHPDSPATANLRRIGENLIDASAQMGGADLTAMMTEGFEQITFTSLDEGEDRWAFEVTVPEKQPVRIIVAKLDEGWRVLPPEGGNGLPVE